MLESEIRAKNKYNAKSYDRLDLYLPKGYRALLVKAASGRPVTEYVKNAIDVQLLADGLVPIPKKSEQ